MKFERDDAKLGCLVLLAAGIFGALLLHRSITAAVKKETAMVVYLDYASDLTAGTEVQLHGLRVGQVNRIELQQEGVQYHFKVSLGLRPDIVLWKGTRILASAKPLGGAFLDLQIPPIPERKEILQAGSVLPGTTGSSLSALIEEVQAFIRNLNQTLNSVRNQGLGAFLDHPKVSQVITNADAALAGFRDLAKDSQNLVRQGQGTVEKLDQSLATLNKSLASIQALLDAGDLANAAKALAATLKEAQALSAEARSAMRRLRICQV